MKKTSVSSLLPSILLWLPLAALPLMLNLRWLALNEPNEPPKWAVFTLTGLLIAVAFLFERFMACRRTELSTRKPQWPEWMLGLFMIGIGLGVTYATNPGTGMSRWAFWCCAVLVVAAVNHSVRAQPSCFLTCLRWTLALSLTLFSLFFWHGFFFDFQQPGFNAFVMFSRIGHFNYTADALVWLIPLLTWTWLTGRGLWHKALTTFALASSLFMLVTSGSLGGMVGLLAGGLISGSVWLVARLRRGRPDGRSTTPGGLRRAGLGLLLVALLGLAGQSVYPHIPQQYRDLMLTRAEWWSAPKANALDGAQRLPPLTPLWLAITPYLGARTPMWAATAGMIAEHPWRGFGTGSYLFEYPAFEKRYDLFKDPEVLGAQIRTDPHNVLLWIAAENGLPLTLLFAVLYAWLALRVTLETWRTRQVFWLCGTWALWAAGLDALVNQVFFSPASLFVTALGVGLWYGGLPYQSSGPSRVSCRLWGNAVSPVLGSVVALWLASYPLTWLVSTYYVAEARRLASAQPAVSYRQILLAWVNARRCSPTNGEALYGLANAALSQKHYASAEGYLKAFLKLAPHHTPGLNLLANIQMQDKRYDEAEKTLEQAIALEPDAAMLRENLETLRKNRTQPQAAP